MVDLIEGGEIRAVADQLLGILDDLRSLEERKRNEPLGTETFVRLAEAAEAEGRLVFRWTGLQLEVARDAERRRAAGELDPDVRIEDLQAQPLDRILAAWREAQIRLEMAMPGSAAATDAAAAIERLRDQYRAIADGKAADAASLAAPPGQSIASRGR